MKRLPVSSIVIFVAAALIYAVGAATRAGVPGMVFDLIRSQLGLSAFQTAGIAGSGVAGCIAFIGVSGFLIDRYGWKALLIYGACFQIGGAWLMQEAGGAPALWAGAFLNGGGRTIGYLSLLKLLDTEFERRRFALLIGFFYIFSYGGTFCGTAPFEWLLKYASWQRLLLYSNLLTAGLGVIIALTLLMERRRRPAAAAVGRQVEKAPRPGWRETLAALSGRRALAAFLCCGSGLVIYWSILGGLGRKFLADHCHASSGILGVMNLIVMAEMIFAGALSYCCGNRRKPFQLLGTGMLAAGALLLFAASCPWELPALPTVWAGFAAIGVGYGMTAVNITACREFVPASCAASAIGTVNFCANILMIGLMQLAGWLFDRFHGPDMTAGPAAFRIVFLLCAVLALAGFAAALTLPETHGNYAGGSRKPSPEK